jgi:hypothetical protein
VGFCKGGKFDRRQTFMLGSWTTTADGGCPWVALSSTMQGHYDVKRSTARERQRQQ